MVQRQLIQLAIVCANTISKYRLPASFFVFSAEFLAIKTALKLISSHSHKHCIIYTDSRSVLKILRFVSCLLSFISILQLYNELCNKRFYILFCQVSTFVSVKGNESADKAAKEACNPLNSPILYSNLKLAQFIRNKQQREWDGQSENKLKKEKPCIAFWTSIDPSKFNVVLSRLRTGHLRLMLRYLLPLDEEEPACLHCHSSVLTIRHLLTDCIGLCHMYRHHFSHLSSLPSLTEPSL